MKVPISWLRDFVDINISPSALAEKLCNTGIIVEKVECPEHKISGVLAGKILEIKKHENADKLRVALVDTGKEKVQIVTGAQNVKENDIIPVALVDAKLSGGLMIKKSQLRGVDSFGMMCSAKELGIDIKDLPVEEQQGVMILPASYNIGEDIASFLNLNDVVLVIEPFANRPDCLSITGIAYEAAYVMGEKLKRKEFNLTETLDLCSNFVNVKIENYKDCPRYIARIIKDIKIAPSSLKMKLRLNSVGIRSVNNMVDITNYVMMETGNPLHAFDYDKITGTGVKDIIVRRAKKGEHIVTIDEQNLKLDEESLVITDSGNILAIAGVMGGKESEVSDSTKTILLEAALFNPFVVRKSSIKFNLKSESSKRFEKGLDFYSVENASRQASFMMSGLSGTLTKGAVDNADKAPGSVNISLKTEKVNKLLGSSFKDDEIAKKLLSMGYMTEKEGKGLKVIVPSRRKDIKEEIDLVEEVARLAGYDNIKYTLPRGVQILASYSDEILFEKKLRNIFEKSGLNEVITYTMLDSETLEKFKVKTDNCIKIMNPLSVEQSIMRPELIPSIVSVLDYNLRNKNEDLFLFEISHIYREDKVTKNCAGVLCPEKDKTIDFFALKGMLENLFKTLNLKMEYFADESSKLFHPGINADIFYDGKKIGHFGKLHPEITEILGIDKDVFAFEFDVKEIEVSGKSKKYKDFSRYPAISRDLAVIVNKNTKCGDVENVIRSAAGQILSGSLCFDEYAGGQIGQDKKSLAFSLTYQSHDRTLKDEEVNGSLENIKSALKEKLNAGIRE